MILQKGTTLYRYCLGTNIPPEWSTEYHSPEYHSDAYGEKNQIGAFFFYTDEETARNVLGAAIRKAEERGETYDRNTITSCTTTDDINLLDLTGCVRPVQMLNTLHDEGIDVLTSEFVRHLNGEFTFDTVRGYHEFIMENELSDDRFVKCDMRNCAAKIDDFFQWLVGYTGQVMTDFGNGIPFKRELQAKGYEGYQFMEEKYTPTICLFNAEKLTAPNHVVQTINN